MKAQLINFVTKLDADLKESGRTMTEQILKENVLAMLDVTECDEEMEKIIALSNHLGESFDDCESHIDNESYLVLNDDEADEKAAEGITDSLWAFNASFISEYCGEDGVESSVIEAIQGNDQCEGNNDAMKSLVGNNLDDLIEAAIAADGRGHFLNTYDGEENEADANSQTYYVYRIN